MKSISYLLILLFFKQFNVSGQSIIKGELKHYAGENFIIVRKPINGSFSNISYSHADTIGIQNSRFEIHIDNIQPVFIIFCVSGQCIRMIATPNDTVYLTLDFSNLKNDSKVKCQFSGANAEGHQFFYEYDYYPAAKYE